MKKSGATTSTEGEVSRREVLLGAIAFVGGAATLSSCGQEAVDHVDLHSGEHQFFDAEQMRLLGRVVDIVIPETDTPGALAAGADRFIDGMMATWASKETQSYFTSILREINDQVTAKCGADLADCDAEKQQQLLRDIDNSAFGPETIVEGFRDLKYLILAAYYTSEIGATIELQFELVPGRYIPCAPIDEIGRAWAHR